MARTQEFDTAKALGDARTIFWDKGFESTSIADLEAATGLGRSSIYHGFGSKRGLFDAVIQDYMDSVLRPRLRLLQCEPGQVTGVLNFLVSLSDAVSASGEADSSRGCLLLNTTAGMAGQDEAMRILIDGYQRELRDGVAEVLRAADATQSGTLVLARSRIIAGLTVGALVMARLNPAEAVETLAAAGTQVVGWFPGSAGN